MTDPKPRTIILLFDRAVVPAGAMVTTKATLAGVDFQPKTLFIPDELGPSFVVDGLSIGGVAVDLGGRLSARRFSPLPRKSMFTNILSMPELTFPRMRKGEVAELRVWNVDFFERELFDVQMHGKEIL